MIEITGSESKIEGLLQVLNENDDRVLEISRTGRMVMRRGHHTSRVLEALGDVESQNGAAVSLFQIRRSTMVRKRPDRISNVIKTELRKKER